MISPCYFCLSFAFRFAARSSIKFRHESDLARQSNGCDDLQRCGSRHVGDSQQQARHFRRCDQGSGGLLQSEELHDGAGNLLVAAFADDQWRYIGDILDYKRGL